jgi:aryl-alcohol dehydrogenase-like predicted oxidoreductase
MPKLILGTATFGTGYGISNTGSVLSGKAIGEIVAIAQENGINEFDTAPGYGMAENYLGVHLDFQRLPRVSSKVSKDMCHSAKSVLTSVENTLLNTKVRNLTNLYLHDADVLTGVNAKEIIAGLKEAIGLKLVERIGVSVYNLETILRAKDLFPELTVFQVPENICDRRMFHSKELIELSHSNIFIVRSVFLQGLLLMSLNEIPTKLIFAEKVISELKELAANNQVTPLDICLAYGQAISWADGIIVGAANALQLQQIIQSNIEFQESWLKKISVAPPEIVDPRTW